MEKLYSRKEAAQALGISLTSLDEARYARTISYIQYVPGGSVLFSEEALQAYIARGTHQAVHETPASTRQTYRKPWHRKQQNDV